MYEHSILIFWNSLYCTSVTGVENPKLEFQENLNFCSKIRFLLLFCGILEIPGSGSVKESSGVLLIYRWRIKKMKS